MIKRAENLSKTATDYDKQTEYIEETDDISRLAQETSGLVRNVPGFARDASGLIRYASELVR